MFAKQCVYIKKRNNFAFVVKNHCKPLKTNQNEIEIYCCPVKLPRA